MPSAPSSRLAVALARLQALHPKLIDLSLGRIQRLLSALGAPHRRLPPVIHVAGTNGKGSTLAFLRAILEAAGYRVHVYTSPHLLRFNERIRLAGSLIGDDHLIDLFDRTETANAGAPITYFEVATAAAFLGFAEVSADALLLETGVGGRLDATNVVERPVATAITRISYDHRQFLGDTLDAIAGEKAGILKAGVACALALQQEPIVCRVIAERAAAIGAPLIPVMADDCAALPAQPNLTGRHQLENAATATVIIRTLRDHGFRIDQDHIAAGLAGADWPGRLQRVQTGPFAAQLPAGAALWYDGGHNDSAGAALAAWAAEDSDDPGTPPVPRAPLHLIIAMSAAKRAQEFLAPFAPVAASCCAVPLPAGHTGYEPRALADEARAAGLINVRTAETIGAAVHALAALPPPFTVLICGSLYLAKPVLSPQD